LFSIDSDSADRRSARTTVTSTSRSDRRGVPPLRSERDGLRRPPRAFRLGDRVSAQARCGRDVGVPTPTEARVGAHGGGRAIRAIRGARLPGRARARRRRAGRRPRLRARAGR
jgi:hypothetical protein